LVDKLGENTWRDFLSRRWGAIAVTSRSAESEKSTGDCGIFRRPVRKIPQFIPSLGLKSTFNQGTLIAH
jgi:hypothetical protein